MDGSQFDFIIVGAGSSGCVLAERLTASGRHTVLLLEAGGTDRRFFVQMPLGYGKLFYDPSVNWMYWAEPDQGLAGQRDYWPRGKIIGGSSSINAMVYVRGHPADYEDWKAQGNSGWGWPDVLKAYKEIEDYEGGDDEFHGRGGPLRVSGIEEDQHPLCESFFASCASAGLKLNSDFNGRDQEGVGCYRITTKLGRRMSSSRAFLGPAKQRRNLKILSSAFVTRILLEGTRARGVQFIFDNKSQTAFARREVIVSAGSVNTPQLLQLSGLGPPQLLKSLGLPVNLPNENIGRNLEDHVGLNYTWRVKVPTLNEQLRPWFGKAVAGLRYLMTRKGPLSLSINQAGGFFRTSEGRSRPNMQLYMQPFSTLIPKDGERPILSPDPFPGMSLGLSNCRPTSRGEILIQSPDPMVHPRIIPNAYSTHHDIQEMLEGVKMLRRIAGQSPLSDQIVEELRPGPSCQTDAELEQDIRSRSGTVYHPSCTCRMGTDPLTSVVDPTLRVHGIIGLRICDASIFPNIVSGNTNAAAIMIGWKGSELILADR
jgi:choline dehydrogenase